MLALTFAPCILTFAPCACGVSFFGLVQTFHLHRWWLSPVVTCDGGAFYADTRADNPCGSITLCNLRWWCFSSTHSRKYCFCTRATCTVWWSVVVVCGGQLYTSQVLVPLVSFYHQHKTCLQFSSSPSFPSFSYALYHSSQHLLPLTTHHTIPFEPPIPLSSTVHPQPKSLYHLHATTLKPDVSYTSLQLLLPSVLRPMS